MNKTEIYNQCRQAVKDILSELHLDNYIHDQQEGDSSMPKRMKEQVVVNGETHWITGYTFQDMLDNYNKLIAKTNDCPYVADYVIEFFNTYKAKQEQNTIVNRNRMIKNHIIPYFSKTKLFEVTSNLLQEHFNKLEEEYSHETLLKIKNILNPAFKAAVEDGYMKVNPFDSSRLVIGGKDTVHHKAIPHDKIEEAKANIDKLEEEQKLMAALLCYTGMRFEEVLGLKWEDFKNNSIYIERAVVHPKRNMPVIKKPKTKSSIRVVPQQKEMMQHIQLQESGFIFTHDKLNPLSYTEARRVFDKMRKALNLEEYSAHDFRDTCATEWREAGIPLDVIARMLGHTKTETTETRYVKYRDYALASYFE